MQHRLRILALSALAFAVSAHAQTKPPSKAASAARAKQAEAQAAAASAPIPGAKRDEEKENAGKAAAIGWLSLLDRRDWGSAWEHSSSVFRKNVPLANWMDGISKVREPFGPLAERQPLEVVYKTTLQGHPDGDYVSVIFASKFEKKPDARELVTTMRDTDGRWRVTGYSVQ
jgi:hypothetical protein